MSTRELDETPWPTLTSASLTAYTDESGNTGNDLFATDQPHFFTGTLLTPHDLESAEAKNVAEILSDAGLAELHGTEIKEEGIELVADALREIIARNDCLFLFTQTEKNHFGVMKLADCLLDSGNNQALMPLHYFVKPLKLLLIANLDAAVHARPEILKQFWDGYTKKRVAPFVESLRALREGIDATASFPRNRELLFDAVNWAIENPKAVMDSVNAAFDSPNVIAVVQIVHFLHELVDGRELKVARFIHDRQSQFAPAIKQMYKFIAPMMPKAVSPMLMAPTEWAVQAE